LTLSCQAAARCRRRADVAGCGLDASIGRKAGVRRTAGTRGEAGVQALPGRRGLSLGLSLSFRPEQMPRAHVAFQMAEIPIFEEPVRRDSTNDPRLAAFAGRVNRVEGGRHDAFNTS
jgi:hypothetical protein